MPLGTSADYEAKLPLFFRSCGRFSPKLWKNATFARDTGDVCSRIVPYLMPCCLISHVLFHVLSSPISCLVVSSSFAVAQPILSQISSRPRRVAADLREGHNQVLVGTQKPLPSTRSRGEGRGCAYWWIDSTKISSSGGITSLLSSYWAQLQTCPCP